MDNGPASTSGPPSDASRISFDQLDTLVRVTTVQGWTYLATLFAVGASALAFAILYKVPTKVNGDGILLIDKDTLAQVRARATGRLMALSVHLGDWVEPGEKIGQISQDDLEDAIREADSKLSDLRREDQELTAFEDRESQRKESAIARVEVAILRAQETARDKLKIAQRAFDGADRLREQKHLGDLELLETREKFYDIRNELNNGQSRLAELDLDRITAENLRGRARLERRLRIKQMETRLALDREKRTRTSQIVSPAGGRVAQVLSAGGELVREGSPVVLLHAPKAERGADDSGSSYESIVFVSAGEGKKIEVNDPVEIVPSTVKREEHGFIFGRVVAVAELPATKLAMEAALEHPELVDAFLKRYAPGVLLRVHVALEQSGRASSGVVRPPSDRHNPFRWSSSSGPEQPLRTGTMCQAAIVVEKRRLIMLILPWTRKLVGAD
jgi:HlyD family secretion protein